MQLSQKFIGILALCGGVAIAYGTMEFREVPGQVYGSAFFPRILAACFIIIGLVFVLEPAPVSNKFLLKKIDWEIDWLSLLKQLSIPLTGILWILCVEPLGFMATTLLLLFGLMQIARGKLVQSIFIAAALTFALYFIFGSLLRVPLPFGFVEQVLL